MSTYALSKKKALERIFVFQAVEYGYLTQDQLRECIEEHEKRDPPVPLLTICKEKKYLKPSQINYLMSRRLDSAVAKAFVEYTRDQQTVTAPAPTAPAPSDTVVMEAPLTIEAPTTVSEEEVRQILKTEQKKRESLERKIEELLHKIEHFEHDKKEIVDNRQGQIVTLEAELNCYKGLCEQMSQSQKELQARLEEREAVAARERQKSQSLYKLVDQSAKELRESEEERSKAEGELQKKYKEIEHVQEKLEKENKEKIRHKEEFEEVDAKFRKLSREMDNLREERERLEKTLKESPSQVGIAPGDEMYKELTRRLEKKDLSEAELKERQKKLEEQRKELEERQKDLLSRVEQLKKDNEELAEKFHAEKKQIQEQSEKEREEKEEAYHKVRISLETDLERYKEKSDQLAAKLKQYEESLKNWDELEREKKELQKLLEEETKAKKKAEREQLRLEQQLEKWEKETESLRQMVFTGELEAGVVLSGSGGERYVIQKLLGRGGMGITYSAERSSDQTIVVVKTLLPEAMADMKVLMRFVQEARTILAFDHDNLVKGYDVYQGQNFSYFVMEYLDGHSVEDILEEQVFMDQVEATRIVLGIAKALAYLEQHHLVHRDVKPANIIVHSDGAAKLVDFGIVKMTDRTCSLTTEGIILGTPYYLSPEQTCETNVDIRSDIYSLGATYYHMVVGEVPFTGDNPIDVIQKRLVKSPKPGRAKPDLHRDICNVIEKMMSRTLKKRHETAQELVDEMEKVYKRVSRSA